MKTVAKIGKKFVRKASKISEFTSSLRRYTETVTKFFVFVPSFISFDHCIAFSLFPKKSKLAAQVSSKVWSNSVTWNMVGSDCDSRGVQNDGSEDCIMDGYRYTDVLCIDKTRVVLKGRPMNADYIHANWLLLPSKRKYICTQGPLDETTEDFWLMVFKVLFFASRLVLQSAPGHPDNSSTAIFKIVEIEFILLFTTFHITAPSHDVCIMPLPSVPIENTRSGASLSKQCVGISATPLLCRHPSPL